MHYALMSYVPCLVSGTSRLPGLVLDASGVV
jgi:hypothetical protein